MTEFDRAARRVMTRSGGYLSDALRGAATHYGITQRTYTMWRSDHKLGWKNLVYMTPDDAKAIYREKFWDEALCDELPTEVRELHFDTAVCHHVRRAIILLHEAAQLEPKDYISPAALAQIGAMAPTYLRARYLVARYRFYAQIVARDPGEASHLPGWMAHMQEFGS